MTRSEKRPSILSGSGAPALLGSSIFARLPLAMFSIALLVHAQHLTGSFAVAGAVSGAYAIAGAVSAPFLGRLVDRCGQTTVLVSGATATALALLTTGLLPSTTAPLLLVALAAATGLATPPLEACVRTLLPAIVAEPSGLPALFALESTLLELTFVFGPPLALGLGALWSTGAALVVSGLVMLVFTLAFAAQPASRRWRPDLGVSRPPGGSLRSPAIRTLVLVLVGTGAVFGAVDVGVTAAAKALGSTTAAGPLLALWGVGSLLGGVTATRLGGGARRAGGLIVLLAALALSHGALIVTTGSVLTIGAVIVLAGATIAPTEASIYAMVDRAATAGTRTEAFSWLWTASSTGAAAGAGVAGALAQSAGAPAAFAFAGAAGAIAVLIVATGSRNLDDVPAD
jgi:MFS family permease